MADPKHLDVTLDTQVESVNLAEEMCLRVAEAAGFDEDDCYRIGMSVREGVINAFHYGNQEQPGTPRKKDLSGSGPDRGQNGHPRPRRGQGFQTDRCAESVGGRESVEHLRARNFSNALVHGRV
jgi:hypothetical protein